jgi:sec-independent protein translocase protein TatB
VGAIEDHMGIESPVHLLFIAVVALVVLGPKRLPGLARALGQGIREFRQSLDEGASAPAPDVHVAPEPHGQTVAPAASASSATPTPAPQAPAAVSSAPAAPPAAPSPAPAEHAPGRDATSD